MAVCVHALRYTAVTHPRRISFPAGQPKRLPYGDSPLNERLVTIALSVAATLDLQQAVPERCAHGPSLDGESPRDSLSPRVALP